MEPIAPICERPILEGHQRKERVHHNYKYIIVSMRGNKIVQRMSK